MKLRDGNIKHIFHLSTDLSVLFSSVLASGQVPTLWCSAYLSAVFKKDDPSCLTTIVA